MLVIYILLKVMQIFIKQSVSFPTGKKNSLPENFAKLKNTFKNRPFKNKINIPIFLEGVFKSSSIFHKSVSLPTSKKKKISTQKSLGN